MLVLTRHKDESITIRAGEEEITVTVCMIKDGKVRLGFVANKDRVNIVRSEVDGKAQKKAG